MKKITREETKVIYNDVYISVDGKEFDNENDCQSWEKSYKGTLSASWELIKKEEACTCDLGLPWSSEEHECYILKPKSLDEITLINAYLSAFIYDFYPTLTTEHINKLICLNFGYDRDFCDLYILENHLDRINKYINEKSEKLNNEGATEC